MPNIVDSTLEQTSRRSAPAGSEKVERGLAIAAVVQAIPWFVWAAPLVLLFGFIALALWFQRDSLSDFTGGVLLWLSRVLIGLGVVLGLTGAWKCYRLYHTFMLDAVARRTARAGATKAIAVARGQELKNELTQADIELRQQIPQIILALTQTGVAFKYDAKGTLEVLGAGAGRTMVAQMGHQEQLGEGRAPLALGAGALPTKVLYEEVRGHVPQGHFLVGVGVAGIETKEAAIGACVWIVGLSGTGKTSTTVIRVEERANAGHQFLGVDPHWFKDDSLYHSIYEMLDGQPGAYQHLFLKSIARDTAESKVVLQAFLDEFYARKAGRVPKPWQKITLLVDELGALVDTTCEEEEEVKSMLKTISRICGQEARNFGMGGIFISQQATELAWLRKVALMVIVHQLMQESEKKLATNNDRAVMEDMKTWPIGRTYVFGVGFGQEGPRTVQQPYFAGRRVSAPAGGDDPGHVRGESSDESKSVDAAVTVQESPSPVPALVGDMRRVYDAVQQLINAGERVSSRAVERLTEIDKDKANGLLNRLEDLGYISRRKAV